MYLELDIKERSMLDSKNSQIINNEIIIVNNIDSNNQRSKESAKDQKILY